MTSPSIPAHRLSGGVLARLAPRTRLLVTLLLVLAIAMLREPAVAAVAVLAGLALVGLAGIPPRPLLRRLLHVEGFLVVLLLMLPFTIPGVPLFTVGPIAASAEGLTRAGVIVLKVTASALTILALVGPLGPIGTGRAMAGLRLPTTLIQIFLLCARFVGLFSQELERLREAMRARAFSPRSDRHSWRTIGNLAGMVLVRALDRASRVDEAMRCRAYAGMLPVRRDQRLGAKDLLFMGGVVAAAAGLLLADRLA